MASSQESEPTLLGVLAGVSHPSSGAEVLQGVSDEFCEIQRSHRQSLSSFAVLTEARNQPSTPHILLFSLNLRDYLHLVRRVRHQRDEHTSESSASAEAIYSAKSALVNFLAEAVEKRLKDCDLIVIASVTSHIASNEIERRLGRRCVVHVADVLASRAREQGVSTLGIIGSAITMEDDEVCIGRLRSHGIEVIVPAREQDRHRIQGVVEQLALTNCVSEDQRAFIVRVIKGLWEEQGCGAVALACCELESRALGLLSCRGLRRVNLFSALSQHISSAAETLCAGTTKDRDEALRALAPPSM